MGSRTSLRSFLASARTALTVPAAQRSSPLTFVVGNESADLDSLCSAVVLAYLRSSSPPHTLHIPLSNLPRSDLALRTEMAAVLRHAGLGLSDLLTLSELPELEPEATRWVLVDHNALTGPLKKYGAQVEGCVDHHVDEGVVSEQATPRTIEPCGSCMSLVVEESKDAWEALPQGNDAAAEDDRLAKLCLAPILIDTINMTAEDKIRDKDHRAVAYLKGKTQDQALDQTSFHEEIATVKEDISELSFRDIFRKDYKEWQEGDIKLGISSIVQDLDFLVNKGDGIETFLAELSKWADERSLDIASVMTASGSDDGFHRNLLVWARNDKSVPTIEKFLDISGKLQLETWRDGSLDDGKKRMAWKQGDLTGSRKKVAPLLRDAIKKA